ncbi:helix-turn-helix transcriptional regulator [Calidifontibacter sp. DB0510]|uniref:Helix-turn-helix transcriptional regulator n=1 Tax=Metallococcus carri TaxID=1656884 RepID=A0A967B3V6_9MICO|nr:helix-turn-helix domain-containing protein [Metallococcus carri]NHN56785.1 helix-turn-helix transcriptional regulator [Metallococcus carri]NOP37838.1 helix-turn-helix transcriptional regulator [Calidifontibacter sp. DB2511S]
MPSFDVLQAACPSRSVLRHLTDRWTPMVVAVLSDGPARFGQIRGRVEGVTAKVLTETLRSMERDGLVTRTAQATMPPRVDYELTPLGRTLVTPLAAVRSWAEQHAEQVLEARARYDDTVD